MSALQDLPARAFAKADPTSDDAFYATPRFVTHIDDGAIAAVTRLYRALFPEDGTVLDLMSSWVSHLPNDIPYREVIGHGLNRRELDANPRLTRRFVQNLNENPELPLEPSSVDAAGLCVSVQYLQRPVDVLTDVCRVLRPDAPLAVTFSNRCFPTKAVAIWHSLDGGGHCGLVRLYLERAGFDRIDARLLAGERGGDPLWAVVGRKPERVAPV